MKIKDKQGKWDDSPNEKVKKEKLEKVKKNKDKVKNMTKAELQVRVSELEGMLGI